MLVIIRAKAGTQLSAKINLTHSWSVSISHTNADFQPFRTLWQVHCPRILKRISSLIRHITPKLIVRLIVKLIGLEIISGNANNCRCPPWAVLGKMYSTCLARCMRETYVMRPWLAWKIITKTKLIQRLPISANNKEIPKSIKMQKLEVESFTLTNWIRLTIQTDSSMSVLKMPWLTLTSQSATKLNCLKTILDTCLWSSKIP